MSYPLDLFRQEIKELLQPILTSLGYNGEIRFETPPSMEMGDLSYACFQVAKIVEKPPFDVAKDIAAKVKPKKWVDHVMAMGGYVNFFVNVEQLIEFTINVIRSQNKTYGSLEKKQKRVIIEHTSANPNGPLHIGRARNPILGDTLVRLYRYAGYEVESQFYLDDLGKQVAILAWGVRNIDSETLPKPGREKPDHVLVRFYQQAYKLMDENEKVAQEINEIVKLCEKGDEKTLRMVRDAFEPVLEGIKQSLAELDIYFDRFVSESEFMRDKSVDKVVEALKKTKYSGREGGAWYIDLKPFGVSGRNTKFFFTRNDGTTLYATRDIAYHLWKAEHADMLINVLGEDHKLEAKQVEIALKLIGAKTIPKVVFYSFVTLPGGKMSTRRGRVVYLDDLIDEAISRAYDEVKKRRGNELTEEKIKHIARLVGLGSIRYNILKIQPEKDIVFKWEDALNFEGYSAPFVQYAHARASSILKKMSPPQDVDAKLLAHKQETMLIKILAKFPDIIREACSNNRPNLIANYLYDLAAQFNQFYRDCPVLKAENKKLRDARLALVQATSITLRNGLYILGVSAPEEM
ncbi:MAG TPA: arginine--tRNA ligase [Thermoplasmatales archaeon]|nr:arginine--tRNA ligase [Thermoplasmatales archaeon]